MYWKTGTRMSRREGVVRPSLSQLLRQVGVVLLIGVLWGGVFAAYLSLTAGQEKALPGSEPEIAAAPVTTATSELATPTPEAVTPTTSATPLPASDTPTLMASDTPSSAGQAATPQATATEMPSPEPSPTATDEPTPLPTPTSTLAPSEGTVTVSFAGDVLPILERRCVKCHGGERTEEGLVLKSYADLMAGSWNGPVIEPGNAEASYLVQQITSGKMPKREPSLLPGEIRLISEWIEAGAADN